MTLVTVRLDELMSMSPVDVARLDGIASDPQLARMWVESWRASREEVNDGEKETERL